MEGVSCLLKRSIWMLLLLNVGSVATLVHGQGISVGFYSSTCPGAEDIVRSTVESHFKTNPAIAPGILRMHFHDCFVQGCDGSILINGPKTERTAGANLGLRGYDVIDDAKTQLEAACPGVVSCADILALAARDSVVLTKGIKWQVPTGRRDGLVSLASDASTLPGFTESVDSQKQKFAAEGLKTQDLVTLVGGHTIGTTACQFFRYRLYNFSTTSASGADPTINSSFAPQLQALCPQNGDGTKRVELDTGSSARFDASFFENLGNRKGILESDQKLWTDRSTRTIVQRFLGGNRQQSLNFSVEFAKSMVKMSNIGVKTGTQGEIRKVQTPEDTLNANRLIFPGVGAFAAAMDVLTKNGMDDALCAYIEKDRPFLGICLGLQLLFESSEENGPVNGLGLIPGVVQRFNSSNGFRVPHIGWNALQIRKDSDILDDVGDHHVYFVHSYRAIPSDENKDWISSTCNYGDNFIASERRGSVHAVQFHQEKSGDVGLSVLRRFLKPKSPMTKQKFADGKASKLAKRVIACLDVRTNDKGDLVVTKGDQYDVREHAKENELRNLGKPVELAGQYNKDGADEVTFLNITGFCDFPLGDLPMLQVLRYTSENVFVPLTVGGGIRDFTDANGRHYSSLEVASEYFRSGADKISIGSDAVYAAEEYLRTGVKTGKTSLEQISKVYGNQAVVVSIDPRRVYVKDPNEVEFKTVRVMSPGPNGEEFAWYQCTVSGGREGRPIGAYELAKAVEELGAGEILLNCIDCAGQGSGFYIDLVKLTSDAVSIPVIASSGAGAGAVEHFSEVFNKTNASAALAAGIFHRKESVKEHLLIKGIEVRI